MMPVKKRRIEFWLRVLRMVTDRLVKWVIVESIEMSGEMDGRRT